MRSSRLVFAALTRQQPNNRSKFGKPNAGGYHRVIHPQCTPNQNKACKRPNKANPFSKQKCLRVFPMADERIVCLLFLVSHVGSDLRFGQIHESREDFRGHTFIVLKNAGRRIRIKPLELLMLQKNRRLLLNRLGGFLLGAHCCNSRLPSSELCACQKASVICLHASPMASAGLRSTPYATFLLGIVHRNGSEKMDAIPFNTMSFLSFIASVPFASHCSTSPRAPRPRTVRAHR